MQLSTKKEEPLPDFLTALSTPSKEFENDCASTEGMYINTNFHIKNCTKLLLAECCN
jgi:hypothetical protein